MRNDRLGEMEAFARVAETGSFSAAARSLGTSQPAISKLVAALEARIGVRLLVRTTRRLTLTEQGAAYLPKCRRLIDGIAEAELAARVGHDDVHGSLRLNTSSLLATSLLLPTLLAFQRAHTGLSIEVTADDRRIDPVGESADLILRVGRSADSSLTQRRAGQSRLGMFGSPAYLRGAPPLATLDDLAAHQIIRFTDRQRWSEWIELVDADGTPHRIQTRSPVWVSNAVLVRDAAREGAGIATLPSFFAAPEVAAGRLVEVLEGLTLPPMEVNFLHPYGREVPRKVSAFMDFAIAAWKRQLD